MKTNVYVEDHNQIDKRFEFHPPHCAMLVEYDDVDHDETDAAIIVLKKLIEKHWDEDVFEKQLRKIKKSNWKNNINGVQQDYNSFEDYLEGIFSDFE